MMEKKQSILELFSVPYTFYKQFMKMYYKSLRPTLWMIRESIPGPLFMLRGLDLRFETGNKWDEIGHV
jgi:hypothetical protein